MTKSFWVAVVVVLFFSEALRTFSILEDSTTLKSLSAVGLEGIYSFTTIRGASEMHRHSFNTCYMPGPGLGSKETEPSIFLPGAQRPARGMEIRPVCPVPGPT